MVSPSHGDVLGLLLYLCHYPRFTSGMGNMKLCWCLGAWHPRQANPGGYGDSCYWIRMKAAIDNIATWDMLNCYDKQMMLHKIRMAMYVNVNTTPTSLSFT